MRYIPEHDSAFGIKNKQECRNLINKIPIGFGWDFNCSLLNKIRKTAQEMQVKFIQWSVLFLRNRAPKKKGKRWMTKPIEGMDNKLEEKNATVDKTLVYKI